MPQRPQRHRPLRLPRPDDRPSAARRGYGSRWQAYRLAFLRSHPLCAECERNGRLTPATVVDHIIPHRGDWELFWREGNHQSLCAVHHSEKTVERDGGFGRERR
jgi:5-methylcytosine-specific restriction protein A